LDDILLDRTPFSPRELAPGKHRLAFYHPAFPPIFRDITLRPGEAAELKVNFWETVGRIIVLVDSWADVYVNDNRAGVTPLKEPLIVPLGTHRITLKNPAFRPWETTLTFQHGDPPCTLKVKLEPDQGSLLPDALPSYDSGEVARLDSNQTPDSSHTVRP
jgi:hypothetical protein